MNDKPKNFRELWAYIRKNARSLLIYGGLPVLAVISIILFTVVLSNRSQPVSAPFETSGANIPVSRTEPETSGPENDASDPSGVTSGAEEPSGSGSSSPVSDLDPSAQLSLDAETMQAYRDAEAENADVKAWLTIPGSNVSDPVLQAHDNSFYLDKGLNKSYYDWGSIFAHFRNNLTAADKLSRNTVLFGHNKNDGLLFGELMEFSDEQYAASHRIVTLTVGDTTTYWVIFSVMDCEVNNDVFYYINANPSNDELTDIVLQAMDRSFWDFDLEVDFTDRLLTLSTCTYKYTYASGASREDVRFVVMARELRPGEAVGDFAAISPNTDRRQPQF